MNLKLVAGIEVGMERRVAGTVGMGIKICPMQLSTWDPITNQLPRLN